MVLAYHCIFGTYGFWLPTDPRGSWSDHVASWEFYACSILPQHVHLVLGRHTRPIRTIVGHLKSNATREVRQDPTWPDDKRPVWGEGGWNVFLNSDQDVRRAIRYVEANPVKKLCANQRKSRPAEQRARE